MMVRFLFFFLVASQITYAKGDFFADADAFFRAHVKDGMVAYDAIQKDQSLLNTLVQKIAVFDLKQSDLATKKAFMINTYNLLAIKGIVDEYPVKSPFDVKDFFDAKRYTVAGEKMSLNMLEKERLYPMFQDPRLHFVLVCAAMSCPKLADHAYDPDTLEAQIESQTKGVLNDPDFVRVKGNKTQVSEIFNWYSNDFKTKASSTVEYINMFRSTPLPSKKTSYYTYDWSLNEQ
ncbi:MAG: DUF547 domain-containing protein [Bacteroidota bacterium]